MPLYKLHWDTKDLDNFMVCWIYFSGSRRKAGHININKVPSCMGLTQKLNMFFLHSRIINTKRFEYKVG